MAVNLQNTLTIEAPEWLSFEYDYGSQDGSKPGLLHLTGDIPSLKALLEEALQALDGA